MRCLITCVVFVLTIWTIEAIRDPYATLGISKRASLREIKRAYKRLAREWHPDKNPSSEAADKFVSINQAYEILSDSTKKERYDRFGTVGDGVEEHGDGMDVFEQFFGGFGDNGGGGIFAQQRIGLNTYLNSIADRTNRQPYLLFAYSNWCHLCRHLEPVWERVVQDLQPLGYGIGTVNAGMDGDLLERLRVSRLPSILVLIEGRCLHYRGNFETRSILKFAKDAIATNLVQPINHHNALKRFLDQWHTSNKVSVLMFGKTPRPRLRYMLAAMKQATFARFAYVQLTDEQPIREMTDALSVHCTDCETIFVFNEFPHRGPVSRLSSSNELSVESINSLVENNKYLVLPRLSSQEHLDELCPVSSRNPRKLCVILVLVEDSTSLTDISALRQFVASTKYQSETVRFAYMYADKQRVFLEAFEQTHNTASDNDSAQPMKRDIVVVWRVEQSRARYCWLRAVWTGSGQAAFNASVHSLERSIDSILHGVAKLHYQAALKSLVDEFSPSWFSRLAHKAVRSFEALTFHLTRDELLPVLSVLGTLALILLIGYALNYAAVSEQRSEKEQKRGRAGEQKREGSLVRNSGQHFRQRLEADNMLHELRAETYFGMIRLQKPGCRTIVILVNDQTKDVLLAQFCRSIWPWRNNKTLTFGYLMVDKNVSWFRKLLEHTLPVTDSDPYSQSAQMYKRLKYINPKQTVGTVLVLCGWKLYFSMYHPLHGGRSRRRERRDNFLGFEDSDEDLTSSDRSETGTREEVEALKVNKQMKLEEVLCGFPIWFDRLFEGSARRYYVPEWPDNLK